MAQNSQQTIPKDKFLTIAINLLHSKFVAPARTLAKQEYREIETGQVMPITTVKMEDDSTVRFNVGLDHSEFQGQLNFGAFKASLSTLLGNLVKALEDKKDVTVFSVDRGPGSVLFGVTGVTVENHQANVMVLGSDVAEEPGVVTLRLMYIDPEQFKGQGEAGGEAPSSPPV